MNHHRQRTAAGRQQQEHKHHHHQQEINEKDRKQTKCGKRRAHECREYKQCVTAAIDIIRLFCLATWRAFGIRGKVEKASCCRARLRCIFAICTHIHTLCVCIRIHTRTRMLAQLNHNKCRSNFRCAYDWICLACDFDPVTNFFFGGNLSVSTEVLSRVQNTYNRAEIW